MPCQAWARSAVAGAITFVLALAAYVPTVAPTITWRNGGADGAELAAAVVSLGIPHPPGYPTYVLLGSAWAALPLGGDPAYRLNLLSAVSAALAAGLSAVTLHWLGRASGRAGPALDLGGVIGGLLLALAPLTWSQATITEVYSPGLAMLSLLGLLLVGWHTYRRWGWLLAAAFVGGLGFGVLPQILLIAPGAIALLVATKSWEALTPLRASLVLAAAACGLSTFAYLPVRAMAGPLVNWGNPSDPSRFWSLVTAAEYRHFFSRPGSGEWSARLLESLDLLAHELTIVGLVLALAGGHLLWRERRAWLGYIGSLALLAVLFRTGYTAEGNAVYLLPAVYGLALLAGLGASRLIALAGARICSRAAVLLGTVLLGLLVLRATTTAPTVDVSADRSAEEFAQRVLAAAPPEALVVSERDATTFALWYRQALGERADLVVVDSRLLFQAWFRGNLVQRYPDLDPAAVRPGGLTALRRPVYLLVGPPGEETLQPATVGTQQR